MTDETAYVISKLNGGVAGAISDLCDKYPSLSEIRLRSDRHVSCISCGENYIFPYKVSRHEIEDTAIALFGGSIYPHMDTIAEGYVCLPMGIRVGICGKAITQDKIITGISDISSLSIRFPAVVHNVSSRIFDKIASEDFSKSFLIYSPPGVGKTTVLRDISIRLADIANKRVCVVDERAELFPDGMSIPDNIDLFVGYPKYKAFEIAARTMNPQYIICDEIGSEEEAWSLLAVQNCGVPVIATAHASDVSGLLQRSGIQLLHEANVFDYYVGIKRNMTDNKTTFVFCNRKELKKLF